MNFCKFCQGGFPFVKVSASLLLALSFSYQGFENILKANCNMKAFKESSDMVYFLYLWHLSKMKMVVGKCIEPPFGLASLGHIWRNSSKCSANSLFLQLSPTTLFSLVVVLWPHVLRTLAKCDQCLELHVCFACLDAWVCWRFACIPS